jgi:hypothetical protein
VNYAGKGTQFKLWVKTVDKLLPALVCAKLALGDCRVIMSRRITKLRSLDKADNSRAQKFVYDKAITAAYNLQKCFNACHSSDELTVDEILDYDVYYSLDRLRTTLKLHGVFSIDYLENTHGPDVKSHHIRGIPYPLFLLLDSFIPYDQWRHHLTVKKTLVTELEKQKMYTNPLFHRLR